MRFLHMNTGFVIAGIVLLVSAAIYFIWEPEQVYFESWSCIHIEDLAMNEFNHNELDLTEHIRLHEIIDLCDEKFAEPIKHQ